MKRVACGIMAAMCVSAIISATAAETHKVDGTLGASSDTQAAKLSSFCLDKQERVLACDEQGKAVRVINTDDTLHAKWDLDFCPQAIACRDDGSIVVAGMGTVVRLNASGKELARGSLPMAALRRSESGKPDPAAVEKMMRRNCAATGLGVSGNDIFVCGRAGRGYTVYRLDSALKQPTAIVEGLRGCCGQMDIDASDGVVYVAANCSFSVIKYDREGKELGRFGKKGRADSDVFVGCCEPKNVTVASNGDLYVSESGKKRVHRFSADGELLDRVGTVSEIRGCVRVTLGVSKDASRVYVLDTSKNIIRVLKQG